MVSDSMGLNSKDSVFNQETLEPDGFQSLNSHQECEIESKNLQPLQATKSEVPMMMNNPFYRPIFSGVPWYGSAVASVPGQLTIFYNGMVNVYNGISPEKAQVIMSLAGNGHFVATTDASVPRIQAHGPTPMTPISTQPCSPVSSPVSVSSHHVGQLTGNETEAAKRLIISLEQGMQSAIPQARKASLARFLEKRKERMMASAPYCLSKSAMDCSSNSNAVVAGEN